MLISGQSSVHYCVCMDYDGESEFLAMVLEYISLWCFSCVMNILVTVLVKTWEWCNADGILGCRLHSY